MVGYQGGTEVRLSILRREATLAADQAHSYFWVRWILTDAIGRVKVNINEG
jgi:hypothetical protein